jgi:exonuclease SbcC
MKIVLHELIIKNFKGLKYIHCKFEPDENNVYGYNETGKTTLLDAWFWLLFGKDSQGKEDFEIKPLTPEGKPVQKLENEVAATITVDGDEILIQRLNREIWRKRRNETEPSFVGNETIFRWNNVDLKESEFRVKIASLVDEKILRILTDVKYFNNNPNFKWQDRRRVLVSLAGEISNEEILNAITTPDNTDLVKELKKILSSKTTNLDEHRKSILASKKKANDELKLIPSRIDELTMGKPKDQDFETIELKIAALKGEIKTIDNQLLSKANSLKAKHDQQRDLQAKIFNLQQQLSGIVNTVSADITNERYIRENKLTNLSSRLIILEGDIKRLEADLEDANKKIKEYQGQRELLLKRFETAKNEEFLFNEDEAKCPTCLRPFDKMVVDNKREELQKNFNKNKVKTLVAINSEGSSIKDNLVSYTMLVDSIIKNIKDKQVSIESTMKEINDFKAVPARSVTEELAKTHDYFKLTEEIKELEQQKEAKPIEDENQIIIDRKHDLELQINELVIELTNSDVINRTNKRINELEAQTRSLAQEIANLEKMENLINTFTMAKINTVESRTNSMFNLVAFKLFDYTIEGVPKETCVTTVNGVPYEDVNNAGKINAGIDIINTLSRFYDVYAPIWIDNRESVIKLLPTESQLINLIVSINHPVLTINSQAEVKHL